MSSYYTSSSPQASAEKKEIFLEDAANRIAERTIESIFGTKDIKQMHANGIYGWDGRPLADAAIANLREATAFNGQAEHDVRFVQFSTEAIAAGLPLNKPTKQQLLENELLLQKDIIKQWSAQLRDSLPKDDSKADFLAQEKTFVYLATLRDRGSSERGLRSAYYIAAKQYAEEIVRTLVTPSSEKRSEAIIAANVDAILLGFDQNMRRAGLTNPENHLACTKCLQAQIIAELALLEAEIRQKERHKNRENIAKVAEEYGHLLRRMSGL